MTRDQVHAVLIALHGDTVLLPNVAVAEMLARDALQPEAHEQAPWLLGHCDWNERRVPVVRLEQLNGGACAVEARRERIVVLNSLGRHLQGGLLALLTQGYPHLVTLNRSALEPLVLLPSDRDDLVLSRVRIASQVALIPDLEALEAEIARAQLPA